MRWLRALGALVLAATLLASTQPSSVVNNKMKGLYQFFHFAGSSHVVSIDYYPEDNKLWMLFDDGESFKRVSNVKKVSDVIMDTYNSSRAFVFTRYEIFITHDQGKHWTKLELLEKKEDLLFGKVHFNADNSNYIMVSFLDPESHKARDNVYFYTTDGGYQWQRLDTETPVETCLFLKSLKQFKGGVTSSVVCNTADGVVIRSDDWFQLHTEYFIAKNYDVEYMLVELEFFVVEVLYYKAENDEYRTLLVLTLGDDLEELGLRIPWLDIISLTPRLVVGVASSLFALNLAGVSFTEFTNTSAIENPTIKGQLFANFKKENGTRTMFSVDSGHSWSDITPETLALDLQTIKATDSGILAANGRDDKTPKLWVLRDGGMSWKSAVDELCEVEFIDEGNVIVAVPTNLNKRIYYSLDHGDVWETAEFDSEITAKINLFSLNYHVCITGDSGYSAFEYGAFDFTNIFNGVQCGDSDTEEVYAWTDGISLNGQRPRFTRRKASAQCFMKPNSNLIEFEPSQCTDVDFECASGFKLSGNGSCIVDADEMTMLCEGSDSKRLPIKSKVAGNQCQLGKKSNDDFIKYLNVNCSRYRLEKKITSHRTRIPGSIDKYIVRFNDVVVVSDGIVYVSHDAGETFKSYETDDTLVGIHHDLRSNSMVLAGLNSTYFLDVDADNFTKIEAPLRYVKDKSTVLFYRTEQYKSKYDIIWSSCESGDGRDVMDLWYSNDYGGNFKKIILGVEQCQVYHDYRDEAIICMRPQTNSTRKELVASGDLFKNVSVLAGDVVQYKINDDQILVETWDNARDQLEVEYCKLSVGKGEVSLYENDDERGTMAEAAVLLDSVAKLYFRSGGNGLADILDGRNGRVMLASVNYEHDQIDFLRSNVWEQTLIANQAVSPKRLRTMVSRNSVSEWTTIKAPSADSFNRTYNCSSECYLHFESDVFRQALDPTIGSTGGMMVATGSVGAYLDSGEIATFMLADGGDTWREVGKGRKLWAFGNKGLVVALANKDLPSGELEYSLDYGDSWHRYQFLDLPVMVNHLNVSHVPGKGNLMLDFILDVEHEKQHEIVKVNFNRLFSYDCRIQEHEKWKPRNRLDGCRTRNRRARNSMCADRQEFRFRVERSRDGCVCTSYDYACDSGYERDTDGLCKLKPGAVRDESRIACNFGKYYFEKTGYTKLLALHCVNATLPYEGEPKACPATENFRHAPWFIATITVTMFLALLVIVLCLWFLYRRGIKRNGGFKLMWQCYLDNRLSLVENGYIDKVVNAIIKSGLFVGKGVRGACKWLIRGLSKPFSFVSKRQSPVLDHERPPVEEDVRFSGDDPVTTVYHDTAEASSKVSK